jgi:signal transduction histidine kinase
MSTPFSKRLESAVFGAETNVMRPHWWMGLMLLALHAALASGIESWWSRALLLSHFGLFLLWQPIWRGERDLGSLEAVLVVVGGTLLAAWNSWWLMTLWISILFALIGGNVPGTQHRGQRAISMLAAIYLIAILLTWVVPHLFAEQQINDYVQIFARYGLVIPILSIFFLKTEEQDKGPRHALDLFYCLFLFLLVTALVSGSFVAKAVSSDAYPMALARTLVVIALLLVAVSLLWSPRAGFAGIGQFLSRHLLSIGLPFEQWMHDLATFADRESDPERFLVLAVAEMGNLPWVAGVTWRTSGGSGEIGLRSEHFAEYSFRGLNLVLYTHWPMTPALALHMKLLSQLVGDFYDAKSREKIQRQNAYTQAIYETGARLTHDVKNLLQSMKSLCGAADSAKPEDAEALFALMKRQLPQIANRLQATLDKLQKPKQMQMKLTNGASWWRDLQSRFSDQAIEFSESGITPEVKIPSELFDGVAENLIQNALQKRKLQPNVRIKVEFSCASSPRLSVSDTGTTVSDAVTSNLFDGPVPSQTGLGIGLYQAARQANQCGYGLILAENEEGNVRFELSRRDG